MQEYKRYSRLVLTAILSIWLGVTAVGLYMEPVTGDLTRLGGYLENDFGWRLPQESFESPLFVTAVSLQDYGDGFDVLVYGDSFSANPDRSWINFFAYRTGVSVIFYGIDRFDFQEILSSEAYLRRPPKLLIYETIERNLLSRHIRCMGITSGANQNGEPELPLLIGSVPTPVVLKERPGQGEWGGGVSGSRAINYVRKAFARNVLGVNITEVHSWNLQGPMLFSSRVTDRMLVIDREFRKGQHGVDDLEASVCGLRDFQQRVENSGAGFFVALLFPDKTTAYSKYIADPSYEPITILERFEREQALNVVSLRAPFQESVRAGTVDLYLPNDTHCGATGYELAADVLIDQLTSRGVLESREGGN